MNKTAQFTPGPWATQRNYAETTESERINIVAGKTIIAETHHAWLDWEEQEANAHLIAAAPAMYEALETVPLPKHNEAIGEFYTRFYTWYGGQVKQALSQAEGRHHE